MSVDDNPTAEAQRTLRKWLSKTLSLCDLCVSAVKRLSVP
jgi:hypothetical protein